MLECLGPGIAQTGSFGTKKVAILSAQGLGGWENVEKQEKGSVNPDQTT